MNLPVRTFWLMSDCLERIQAQGDERQFRVANFAQGGEHQQEFVESLQKRVGKVFVIDEKDMIMGAELDRGGLDELRSLSASLMIG